MSIFGLGTATAEKTTKKATSAKSGNQADEAKALLEKMEQKKDAGDCPFC